MNPSTLVVVKYRALVTGRILPAVRSPATPHRFTSRASPTPGSEGANRLIKTDARTAFGYRDSANQRLRARCATTRHARGHLTTRTSGRHSQPRTSSRP